MGLSRGNGQSPNPAAEGQAGGTCTRGKPWTALDLKTATNAKAGKVRGHYEMPSLGLDHTWLRLLSALVGPEPRPSAKLALFLYTPVK